MSVNLIKAARALAYFANELGPVIELGRELAKEGGSVERLITEKRGELASLEAKAVDIASANATADSAIKQRIADVDAGIDRLLDEAKADADRVRKQASEDAAKARKDWDEFRAAAEADVARAEREAHARIDNARAALVGLQRDISAAQDTLNGLNAAVAAATERKQTLDAELDRLRARLG